VTRDGTCQLEREGWRWLPYQSTYGDGLDGHVDDLVLKILTLEPHLKGSVFDWCNVIKIQSGEKETSFHLRLMSLPTLKNP